MIQLKYLDTIYHIRISGHGHGFIKIKKRSNFIHAINTNIFKT